MGLRARDRVRVSYQRGSLGLLERDALLRVTAIGKDRAWVRAWVGAGGLGAGLGLGSVQGSG